MQKPKRIKDEGKRLKLSPKKNRKTLAGQKQTEELNKEPSDKKGLRPTKKTRAKTQNHENHEDQEDQEATARTAGTAAGKPAKPKATEDVEAEQQRRALQREIQQLVMRLRSEGKTPAEIKSATKELKAKSDWTKKEKLPKAKKEKQRLWEETAAKKRKEHLQKQHDLVIIPVVWRGRHDKLDVLKAAEDIKACLSQQGLDVWLDSRRHLTSGQKFAHWEHRGVLLHVEIGPEDLKAGVCQVCLAHTPGDYKSVQRKRVGLPPSGTRSLLLRLKEWGLEQLEIERRAGDSDEEASDAEAPQGKKEKILAKAPALAEDVQGNWSPRIQERGAKGTKAGKKRKKKL